MSDPFQQIPLTSSVDIPMYIYVAAPVTIYLTLIVIWWFSVKFLSDAERPFKQKEKKEREYSPPRKRPLILHRSNSLQFDSRSGMRIKKMTGKCLNGRQKEMNKKEIDFERELQMPYCQAAKVLYTEDQTRRAIMYMVYNDQFTVHRKTVVVLGKTIEHINELEEKQLRFPTDVNPCTGLPNEPPKEDIEKTLMEFNMWERGEIRWIMKTTYSELGFYPTPTEFCRIYEEKKDQLVKTRKRLRKEVIMFKQRCIKYEELKKSQEEQANKIKQLSEDLRALQMIQSEHEHRHMCKICASNDVSIMVLPCRHVYSCADCFQDQSSKCLICQVDVSRHEFFYLC